MQKWLMLSLMLVLNTPTWAEAIIPPFTPLIDKVSFQLSARQWVNTQSARLTVEVNATLSGKDIVQIRKEIMDNLGQIAKGDWHITRFDRTQDNSGLEKLSVGAEIRVGQDKLTHVYADAKKISKPGNNYAIVSVEFQPGLEDMQQVREALRQQLYQKVHEEMARINAVYKEQHYTLSRLEFSEGGEAPERPVQKMRVMSIAAAAPVSMPVTVSSEMILTAWVEVASNRPKGN